MSEAVREAYPDDSGLCFWKSRNAVQLRVLVCFIFGSVSTVLNASETGGFRNLDNYFSSNLSFYGRLHPQYDYLESDLKGTEVSDPEIAKRDHFRRILTGVKLRLNDQFRLNYLTDLSDRVVKNQIVRLEWEASDRSKWHLGYQKAPFGFEDTTSSGSVKPIERSANTRFWNDLVGLGTYHFGAYQYQKYENGVQSVLGVTHNVMGDSKVPDVLSGDVSLYGRFSKKGKMQGGGTYLSGIDIAYQPVANKGDIKAVSAFSNFSFFDYEVKFQATLGEIGLTRSETARAFSWHTQASRKVSERLECVLRVSQVDTGGYEAKISSLIRKAPYSGFKYEKIDSLYFGFNYFLQGNDLKLSVGYELGEGRDALSGEGVLGFVREYVSGFRVRGQFNF